MMTRGTRRVTTKNSALVLALDVGVARTELHNFRTDRDESRQALHRHSDAEVLQLDSNHGGPIALLESCRRAARRR
jgi:hypothetical protein